VIIPASASASPTCVQFEDASLAGVACWYSLMFLPASDRPAAFSQLARVVKPGATW
jgi:ubiquinone/menaquinone biosynthesis C-methylase UbiE